MSLFSSIFNIKKTTPKLKFTNVDKFFLKYMLICDNSITYNLTKLFQMKLKTTKGY